MNRELLKDVLIAQDRQRTENIVRRSLIDKVNEFRDTPFVIIISGIRRCGKSTLLRSLKDDESYYINFDDERFIGLIVEDLAPIHNLLMELFGERRVFLLDEIQNIPGWERFVRRLQDEGMKVFVTGSNAAMLSRELGTHLTGRNITFSLYPFSFKEYLDFKGIHAGSPERMTSKEKSLLKRAFNSYLNEGGFPEYLETGKDEYLQSLYQNILYRDIITRYGLTSERPLKEAAFYAASNLAKEMSFNKVRKLTGLSSATTVKEYYGYMENSYLTFLVSRYDHSARKQMYYNKKIYFIDTALARLVGFRPTEDHGRMLENIVYIDLRRRGGEIFFHRGKRECDFILRKSGVISEAIQVTTDLEGNKEREFEGLMEALELYDLDQGLILTQDQEGSMEMEGKDILVKPVWQWLLENDA
ncbi:MAG TPA: ATP-binding protein [Euryarchaeota archaeon]|nr:ATP-binding protein [Euryarchaeota archaeon]